MNSSDNVYVQTDMLKDAGATSDFDIPSVYLLGNNEEKRSFILGATSIKFHKFQPDLNICPIEFRLNNSEDGVWSCAVSLLIKYDAEGKEIAEPKEIKFISEIYKPHEVASVVLRAQHALLNPKHDFLRFRDLEFFSNFVSSTAEENELDCSVNSVCVKIWGASYNLSFTSIPVFDDPLSFFNKPLGEFSEKLTKRDNAFLIVMLPYESETVEMRILNRVKKLDREGVRTIGVLFTPYGEGAEHVASDHAFFPLSLGYLSLHSLYNNQIKELDHETKLAKAASSTTLNELDDKDASASIDRVIDTISSNFFKLSIPSLVKLREEAIIQLQSTKKDYETLPKPFSSDYKHELLDINLFTDSVNNGLSEDAVGLPTKIDQYVKTFAGRLFETQPKLFIKPEMKKKDNNYITCERDAESYWCFSMEEIRSLTSLSEGTRFTPLMIGKTHHSIVLKCQKSWESHASNFVEVVGSDIEEIVSEIAGSVFGRFPNLRWKIELKLKSLVKARVDEVNKKIKALFDSELKHPLICDTINFEGRLGNMKNEFKSSVMNHLMKLAEQCLVLAFLIMIWLGTDSPTMSLCLFTASWTHFKALF